MQRDNGTSIDKIYQELGIKNDYVIPRRTINKGTLGRTLNTNYSFVVGENLNTAWNSSARLSK